MLKWPPGMMGAESQGIGSSGDTAADPAEIVAKKMLLPKKSP